LGGGEEFNAVIRLPAVMTTTTLKFGFSDSLTSAVPVDGVWINFAAVFTPTCNTANNSVATTSASIATLTASTWYHLRVRINTASSVTCTIWNDAGAQLGSQTVTTNIPTAVGRELGVVVIGTNSGVAAVDLFALDYLSVGWNNNLIRGR
jgi:hypothetical protein